MKYLLIFLFSLHLLFSPKKTMAQEPSPGVILVYFNGYVSDTPLYGYNYYRGSSLDPLEQRKVLAGVEELFEKWNVIVTTNQVLYKSYSPCRRAQVILTTNYIGSVGGWSKFETMITGENLPIIISSPNLGFDIKAISDCIAHEVGHTLGLKHQSRWQSPGVWQEYNPGTKFFAPIMGVSYESYISLWWKGMNSDGIYQDDELIISRTLSLRSIPLWMDRL